MSRPISLEKKKETRELKKRAVPLLQAWRKVQRLQGWATPLASPSYQCVFMWSPRAQRKVLDSPKPPVLHVTLHFVFTTSSMAGLSLNDTIEWRLSVDPGIGSHFPPTTFSPSPNSSLAKPKKKVYCFTINKYTF